MDYDPLEERFDPARPASPEDQQITDEINRRLVSDEATQHQLVEVVTVGGRVVLSGKVSSRVARSAIERHVRAVPGVRSVINQLTLSGLSTQEGDAGEDGGPTAEG